MSAIPLTAAQADSFPAKPAPYCHGRSIRPNRAIARAAAENSLAPPPFDPVHLGAPDRRNDLLHPSQHAAGAKLDHPRVGRFRNDHGRVVFLYTSGSWPLALIVLIASVMIPLGKLVALAYLLITVQRGALGGSRERTRLYRMVEFIGRWSMLDVFVDTFTVALVQLQPLMFVEPGPGVLFFAAVVVLTMIAAAAV